ncbi:ATP-binding protein [Streptomyces melanogenes]|uniref:ATP-binding protein n=1 Tax=Streptomyces melanogenes TaxID=67326 RepID=A0ABZ1XGD0_9ACTN|nr:ATP-binding protein [Streptomyces melanogenes]
MKSNAAVTNETTVVHRWTRDARDVGEARSRLREALAVWGLEAVEGSALVVLSELVTNAVRHAHASTEQEIQTRYVREAHGVRIEVHDTDDELPAARVPGESGGWGLILVDALAERWGVDEWDGAGKSVWAVVSTPAGGEAPWHA